jgi:urease accessory protein
MPAIPLSVAGTRVVDPGLSPGRARLEFVRTGSRTVVTRAFAASPVRLLTPANHGHAAWVYTSSYGGGLVDGDRLAIEVDVRRHAAAVLSTQASTKVYRSPGGTSVNLNARIENGGSLIVIPDPTVCFAGARYRQAQRFHLSAHGSLVVVDCLICGRCASGERWEFVEYRNLLEIAVEDRVLVHDPLALRMDDGELVRRFGRFNASATVAIIGPEFRGDIERLIAWSAAQKVARLPELLLTVSNVSDAGCLIRIVGTSGERVCRAIRTVLDFIPAWLGDDPWARKW